METAVHGALKVETDRQSDRVRLIFSGQCDFSEPGEVFTTIFDNLFVQNYREIVLSFDGMEFINSSMIPPIIRFIQRLDEKKMNCVITFDGDSKWQHNSFKQLKNFVKAKGIHTVVVRPG
jgi:hypothetical protein